MNINFTENKSPHIHKNTIQLGMNKKITINYVFQNYINFFEFNKKKLK